MATFKVKKVAVAATDLGGLQSSRYEKLQVSYGVIPPITNGAATYANGDYLVFSDVPSKSIIRATVIAHYPDQPAVLEVYPGSDKNVPFTLSLPTGVTAPVEISYIIEYVRGTGRVGTTTGDNSGEGDLFTVVISASSLTAAVAETQVARPAVQLLSTTQFGALSTDQLVALKVEEMPAITTGELRALTTSQVVAFTSTQANALTTTQVASLTAGQTAALRRTV
jgi:hypothetical protein